MISIIKKVFIKFHITNFLLSYLYMFLDRIMYRSKSKIFNEENLWFHESQFGLIPYFHPLFKSKIRLEENNNFFFKYYNLKEGDIILEFGSGIGNEALFISKKIGNTGKIISFEPNKEIFNLLKITKKINNLQNLIISQSCLYEEDTKIGFEDKHIEDWLGGKIDKNNLKNSVDAYTLDSIVQKYQLKKITLCKMNIEGAEKYILKSSDEFFNICENLVISCHDFIGINTYEMLVNFLKDKNYFIYNNKNYNENWKNFYIFAKKN